MYVTKPFHKISCGKTKWSNFIVRRNDPIIFLQFYSFSLKGDE